MRHTSYSSWPRLMVFALLGAGLATATALGQPASGKYKKNIAFEFKNAKWSQVIEWLGDQTGLIVHTTTLPKGTFSFQPDKGTDGKPLKYSVPEIIDILNESLHKEKWTILRTPTTIYVWPANEKIPLNATFFNLITKKELGDWGKTEIVSMYVPVKNVAPEQVAAAMKKVVSPSADVIPFPSPGLIWIRAPAGELKKALKVAEAFDESGPHTQICIYQCKRIKPVLAAEELRKMIPEKVSTKWLVIVSFFIAADDENNVVLLGGTSEAVDQALQLLKLFDSSETGAPLNSGPFVLKQYNLSAANAEPKAIALQEAWKKKSPHVIIKAIGPKAVMVYASPTDQAAIAAQLGN